MNKVYLITSGDYSDYRIDAIFSTKEKADEFLAIAKQNDESANNAGSYHNKYGMEIHELDVVDLKDNSCWEVTISGATGEIVCQHWFIPDKDLVRNTHLSQHDIVGYGKTQEHARRSAEEFRRVLITTPAAWQIEIRSYDRNYNLTTTLERFSDTLLAFQRCEELTNLHSQQNRQNSGHLSFYIHKLEVGGL